MSDFPSDWAILSLGDLVANHDSRRVPLKKADRAKRRGEYPYYGASGVIDAVDDYLFDGDFLLIGEDGANLLARSKPIAFQAHGRFWVNNHAHVLLTLGGMPLGFLEHYINSIDLARYVTGTAQPKLTQAHLNKIPVPAPPLPEQHRIVAAIDTQFSRLDDAVATLERVQRNLKRYRASVLKSAVEGRLVPTEAELAKAAGRDYEPASELLKRILVERRRRWEEAELAKMKAKGKAPKNDKWKAKYKEPVALDTSELPELPEGWCWIELEQVATHVVDCLHSTPKYGPSGYPAIRTADVVPGRLLLDQARLVPEKIYKQRIVRLKPIEDDILYTREGERFGIAACVPRGVNLCLSQRMMQLRLVPDVVARYVMWAMNSTWVYRQAARDLGGSTSPHVNMRDIRRFLIPLPPKVEQQRIVAEIERVQSITTDAESICEASARRASRLRQSVLRWAFEGKLADQDPNDEPASVLLERIKAERKVTGGQNRGKHSRRGRMN